MNRKKDENQRDELLQVRRTKSERKELFEIAKLRGITLSSLVRGYLVNGKLLSDEKI